MWMVLRRGLLVAAAALCWWLTRRIGFWQTLGIWAAAIAVICTLAALLLRTAGVGHVGWKNYFAGFVLQFGYAIGRGRLPGIAITSWAVWLLIGLAAALTASQGAAPALASSPPATAEAHEPSALASILLMLAWALDGGAILYMIGVIVKNFSLGSQSARRLLKVMAILAVLLIASIVIWQRGYTYTAALVAGGPGLLLGGFFGVYMLIILTAGRNARWN